MHTETMREKVFNIRFSEEEWSRLETLSAFHGLNAAGLIRLLMKKEERSLAGQLPESKPAPKKKAAKK